MTSACPACCTGASCGRRRSARKLKASMTHQFRASPASSRSCARATSSASLPRTNGPPSRRRSSSRRPGRPGKGCPSKTKLFEHVRASQSRQGRRRPAMSATPPSAMSKDGVKKLSATYDFAIHTHGSIGPSCAVAEFKDGKLTSLVGVAGDAQSAQAAGEDVRSAARERALHLRRRLRLLRPQRPRRRRRRCGAAGESRGPAGPRAVVARRRAWLGSEGPADADRFAGRAGRAPEPSRPGIRNSSCRSRRRTRSWCRWSRRRSAAMPADETIAPGNIFQNSNIPYKFANIKDRLPSARDDAVPPVLDQDAGPHAEHLRQRMLHGRTCGGGRRRSDRVSAAISRPDRHARHRTSRAAWPRWRNGRNDPRPSGGQSGDVVTGRGVVLLQIRAGAHLHRRRCRSARSSARPAKSAPRRFYIAHDCGQIINPDGCRTRSKATSSRP